MKVTARINIKCIRNNKAIKESAINSSLRDFQFECKYVAVLFKHQSRKFHSKKEEKKGKKQKKLKKGQKSGENIKKEKKRIIFSFVSLFVNRGK